MRSKASTGSTNLERRRAAEGYREHVPDLEELRLEALTCTACDLYKDATQTVFGEGSSRSDVMLIGEQPGDQEDKKGRPFVGPAGRVLDEALERAGIDRDDVYVTNAV